MHNFWEMTPILNILQWSSDSMANRALFIIQKHMVHVIHLATSKATTNIGAVSSPVNNERLARVFDEYAPSRQVIELIEKLSAHIIQYVSEN